MRVIVIMPCGMKPLSAQARELLAHWSGSWKVSQRQELNQGKLRMGIWRRKDILAWKRCMSRHTAA